MTQQLEVTELGTQRDSAWLETFLADELSAVWTVAHAACSNVHDAEEAAAEACARFVAAHRSGLLNEHPDPRGYLLRAVRNTAINLHRLRSRAVFEIRAEPSASTPPDHVDSLAERTAVARAFDRLPERSRLCLRLVAIEGQTMERAGDLLGLSANATRQLTHRTRLRLRHLYVEEMSGKPVDDECVSVVAALATGQELTELQAAHVEACESCSEARDDLRAAGLWRSAPVAIPLSLAASTQALTSGAAPSGGGSGATSGSGWGGGLAAACAAAAVVVASIGALVWNEVRGDGQATGGSPPVAVPGESASGPPAPKVIRSEPTSARELAGAAARRGAPTVPSPETEDPAPVVPAAPAGASPSPSASPSNPSRPPAPPGPVEAPVPPDEAPVPPDEAPVPPDEAPEAPAPTTPEREPEAEPDEALVSVGLGTPVGDLEVEIPAIEPLPPVIDVQVGSSDEAPIVVEVLGIELLPGELDLLP